MGSLRSNLFRFYYKAQAILVPGLQNAQFAYRAALENKLSAHVKWLDIGCGRRLFPPWMPNAEEAEAQIGKTVGTIFGIDPDLASLADNRFVTFRVAGNSCLLPFANNTFDLLSANMVVEHVAQPEDLLSEAYRVLKPGGTFLFHTPNFQSYATLLAHLIPDAIKVGLIGYIEGRKQEDVFPTLYRMNTPGRIKTLATAAGFNLVDVRSVESSAQGVMLGPLVILELLWIRMLRLPMLQALRSNLMVALRKDT
jgi:ubiquinone/menaquinone biosynthesis C-methylase UbiE